jgi:hypothetical protein
VTEIIANTIAIDAKARKIDFIVVITPVGYANSKHDFEHNQDPDSDNCDANDQPNRHYVPNRTASRGVLRAGVA